MVRPLGRGLLKTRLKQSLDVVPVLPAGGLQTFILARPGDIGCTFCL
jgi:hypothetical protein